MAPSSHTAYSTYKWTLQYSHAKPRHTAKPSSLSLLRSEGGHVRENFACTQTHTDRVLMGALCPPVITPINQHSQAWWMQRSSPSQCWASVQQLSINTDIFPLNSLLLSGVRWPQNSIPPGLYHWESLWWDVTTGPWSAHDDIMAYLSSRLKYFSPISYWIMAHAKAHKAACIVLSSWPGQGLDISISHTYSTFFKDFSMS